MKFTIIIDTIVVKRERILVISNSYGDNSAVSITNNDFKKGSLALSSDLRYSCQLKRAMFYIDVLVFC